MRMDVERMTSGVRTTALALSRSLGRHVGAPA
jgi:hypothetical protein